MSTSANCRDLIGRHDMKASDTRSQLFVMNTVVLVMMMATMVLMLMMNTVVLVMMMNTMVLMFTVIKVFIKQRIKRSLNRLGPLCNLVNKGAPLQFVSLLALEVTLLAVEV